MAVNNKFELYKVKREIKRSGKSFDFYRDVKNAFGEIVDGVGDKVFTVKGLYYEHNAHILDSYILMTETDNGQHRIKRYPQIMCITSDIRDESTGRYKIDIDDFCIFSDHKCRVVGIKDFMEWGMVCTISFEAIDYGGSSSI